MRDRGEGEKVIHLERARFTTTPGQPGGGPSRRGSLLGWLALPFPVRRSLAGVFQFPDDPLDRVHEGLAVALAAVHGGIEVPAPLAPLPQLLRRGVKEYLDTAFFRQHRIAVFLRQGVHEIIPALVSLFQGSAPCLADGNRSPGFSRQYTDFPRTRHPAAGVPHRPTGMRVRPGVSTEGWPYPAGGQVGKRYRSSNRSHNLARRSAGSSAARVRCLPRLVRTTTIPSGRTAITR